MLAIFILFKDNVSGAKNLLIFLSTPKSLLSHYKIIFESLKFELISI